MGGLLGGYIHSLGLLKLPSGSPLSLGFVPDRLIITENTDYPASNASEWRRGQIALTGGGSAERITTDTYYASMMAEDGSFKHHEIRSTISNIGVNGADYGFNINGVEGLNTISVPQSTTGTFVDQTDSPFSQGDYLIMFIDKSPATSGGMLDARTIIGMVFDN